MSSKLTSYFIFSSLCLFINRVGAYEDDLAKLQATVEAVIEQSARKSLASTPCWRIGGICIARDLCPGFKFLSQVPGCKDGNKVCCFTWNQYKVRDFADAGFSAPGLPWSRQIPFGGKGLIGSIESLDDDGKKPPKKPPPPSDSCEKPFDPDKPSKPNDPNKPDKPQNPEEGSDELNKPERPDGSHKPAVPSDISEEKLPDVPKTPQIGDFGSNM